MFGSDSNMDNESLVIDTNFIGSSQNSRTYAGTVRSKKCSVLATSKISDTCQYCAGLHGKKKFRSNFHQITIQNIFLIWISRSLKKVWSLTDPSCPLQKRPPDPSVKRVLRPRPQPVQPPIQEIITIPETEITNNKVYGSWNLVGKKKFRSNFNFWHLFSCKIRFLAFFEIATKGENVTKKCMEVGI